MKKIIILLIIMSASLIAQTEMLSLDDCIQMAVANNPDLQRSGFTVEQSRLSTKQAWSDLYPGVSASMSTSNSGPFVSEMADEWNWSLGVSASQQFYRPGMYSSIGLAKTRQEASNFSKETMENQIKASVTNLYFQILAADTLVGVYRANIQLSEDEIDKMKQQVELGMKRQSDLLKAEVQRGTFESQLIRQLESLSSAKRSMNVLLGRRPNVEFDVERLAVDQVTVPNYETALSLMERSNPEIKRLESQIRAQKISLRIAKEAYLPSVSGSYSYNRSNSAFSGSDVDSDQMSLRLSFDIFDGLYKKNNVQINKLSVEDAQVNYDATLRDLDQSLSNQYESLETQNQLIEIHQTNLASARQDLAVVSEQYANGLSSILDLTDAQVSVLQSETSLLQDLYTRKQIEAEIRRLIGQ